MKLYSRGQIILFGILVAALFLFIGVGFGIISFGEHEEALAEQPEPQATTFKLETNPLPAENIYSLSSGDYQYMEDELDNIRIYERLNRGVVNITTEVMGLNWFLEPVPMEGGTGSGSIIDRRGFVLTNYHVVKKAYKVFLTLYDGTQYEGEVVGKDPENDLAVVRFDPGELELITVPFGTSDDLRVGQKVLAIGNPFGYDRTLTVGVVSGIGRPVKTDSDLVIQDMIQTDASINPGNSGGPLLNSQGQMIGINTMIYSPTGGSVGIGFAVPVDTARRVVPDLIEYGIVKRGWIDIVPVQLDRNIVAHGDLPVKKGILVSRISEGGNAEQAGIRGGDRSRPVRYGRYTIYFGGDIITAIDGDPVESLADMFSALEDNKPGERVPVTVVRGRNEKELTVVLSERPDDMEWE